MLLPLQDTGGLICMSKIKKAFENGKAFIAFVTAGDPNLEASEKIIREVARGGADLIEIGIPFSDPIAEGPVIQNASVRALSAGTTTDRVFELVKKIRKDIDLPMVFMTYTNLVYSYGKEAFFAHCRELSMDGIILPDLPYEEKEELHDAAKAEGIDLISMIAPTSEDRITRIAKEAEGFLYVVSSLGVTGVRSEIKTDLKSILEVVRTATDLPAAVGFGISTQEQAKKISAYSDGVIVGSAIVKLIEAYGEEAAPYVYEYVKGMKDAVTSQETE